MSRQSANDTVNNEGAVYRSPGMYLTAEKNPGKPQLGDYQWKLCDHSSPQIGSLTSKLGRWDRTGSQEKSKGQEYYSALYIK